MSSDDAGSVEPRTDSTDVPREQQTAVGVRATYDAVARAYDAHIGDELSGKPLDRALLESLIELAGPGTIADVGSDLRKLVSPRPTALKMRADRKSVV